MGLVSQVFNEDILRRLTGYIACGHNRYSTTGGSRAENAQPVFADAATWAASSSPTTATWSTRRRCASGLERQGFAFRTRTDSEVIAALIAAAPGRDLGRSRRTCPS